MMQMEGVDSVSALILGFGTAIAESEETELHHDISLIKAH
jgi:hypothetical protein